MPERTINDLALGIVFDKKPEPDVDLVAKAARNLPVAVTLNQVFGSGDWSRSKSSGGSVVIGDNDKYVAKVPLGEIERNQMEWAMVMRDSILHFSEVSPKTMVIVATADNDQPKPILIQEKVDGKPLCHSGIRELLRIDTLLGVRKILTFMEDWYSKRNSYDLCGQKVRKNFLGRIAQYIPFFQTISCLVKTEGYCLWIMSLIAGYEWKQTSKN